MKLSDYCDFDFSESYKYEEAFFGKKTHKVLYRSIQVIVILGLIGSVAAYYLGITNSVNILPLGKLIIIITIGSFIIAGICKSVYWLISKFKLHGENTNPCKKSLEGTIEAIEPSAIEPSHNEDPLRFMPKSSEEFQKRQEMDVPISSELEAIETAPMNTNVQEKPHVEAEVVSQKYNEEVGQVQHNTNNIDNIEMMYCRHCGKRIEADSAFCKYCGKRL